jgi:primosomal protein N' (replication factor Y)
LTGARVLLGSATPSIESYYNALQGKYGLVTLAERYGGVGLPPIVLVDTRKVVREDKSKVLLSPALKDAIDATIERDRQVILFQNRRGYTPYQVCTTCGWIPECRNCAVTLTYHKVSNKWQCHYCGTTYPVLHSCPACGGHRFIQKSFGTEKIEEVLQETFPGARVARMDLDTVRGKTAHDQLIHQFEDRRIDILVGTQMVVKGLDFGFVDLVGILDADSLLHFADFRVHERAFQLMEQVSGRAGRKTGNGEVMIQVTNTTHPVLAFVQAHDYKALYDYEIQSRQQFGYPPFSRLLKITFRHKLEETVMAGAEVFANHLRAEFGAYLTGPAAPVVNRVRNQYLMELLVKLPRDGTLIQRCKQALRTAEALLHADQRFRSVAVVPDVDPV